MLQQTRVEVVIPYYLRFVERFPSYASMASSPIDEVLALWSGLGYYRRARSLHACAVRLVELGGFPNTLEGLLELPGIGPYTAAAVASIAWDQPAVALDGNAFRVLSRIWADDSEVTSVAVQRKFRERALPEIPHGRAGCFTQAVMELGATLCLPRNPKCLLCPVQQFCQAGALGIQESLPRIKRSTRKETLVLKALRIEARGCVWLTRQHSLPFLKDLWVPPLFLESDTEFAALPETELLGQVKHGVTFREIFIDVYRPLDLYEPPGEGQWIPKQDLRKFVIPNFTTKILRL